MMVKYYGGEIMEEALKMYYEHFGENYPLLITAGKSDKEIIKRIIECIENNTLESEPIYEDDADY